MRSAPIPALVALLCLWGCHGETTVQEGESPESPQTPEAPATPQTPQTPQTPEAPSSLLEPGLTEEALAEHAHVPAEERGRAPIAHPDDAQTRQRQRLDIDQLNASIRQLTGGIGWTETRNGVEVDLFEALAETLGRPDYLDSTTEDRSPSLIFQKFLNDAARHVCDKLADREAALPTTSPRERYLFIHASPRDTLKSAPDKIDANLRALLLHFHGTFIPEDAPQHPTLHSWRWLFESALHVSQEPRVAWRTVCVGLLTHPDFYTY